MGERYSGAPTGVSVGLSVLPEDTYEVILGEPKAFVRQTNAGEEEYGVRWPFTVAEQKGEVKKGTSGMFNAKFSGDYGEIGIKQEKQMMMACDNVPFKDEEKWNEAHKDDDWAIDYDTGIVGQGRLQYKGKRINMHLGIQAAKDGSGGQFQKFKSFTPIGE